MTYTISKELKVGLTREEVLIEMRKGAIEWGKCIEKKPLKRYEGKRFCNKYFMEVDYED